MQYPMKCIRSQVYYHATLSISKTEIYHTILSIFIHIQINLRPRNITTVSAKTEHVTVDTNLVFSFTLNVVILLKVQTRCHHSFNLGYIRFSQHRNFALTSVETQMSPVNSFDVDKAVAFTSVNRKEKRKWINAI